MTCGIYKLISPNNKIYIGQSIKIEKRFNDHKRRAKEKSTKHSFKLYNSIRKYGWDNFKKEIVEICTPEQLNEREIYYIKLYNSYISGLNGREGGMSGWQISQSTKDKLRKINLGKYNGDQNIEFLINDIKYFSIGDASKKLNIPAKTIYNRLNSTNEKYSNYLYCDDKLIPIRHRRKGKPLQKIKINNIIYESATKASVLLNIPRVTLLRRARSTSKKFINYELIN